jgi:hypothetical protein
MPTRIDLREFCWRRASIQHKLSPQGWRRHDNIAKTGNVHGYQNDERAVDRVRTTRQPISTSAVTPRCFTLSAARHLSLRVSSASPNRSSA